ncbi:MAG: flagellar hook-length control protein FliK [Lachnospiraceae bacterium]|nr:flagellar hook-length control protein FliK [Lachnospiraceae bacterium]
MTSRTVTELNSLIGNVTNVKSTSSTTSVQPNEFHQVMNSAANEKNASDMQQDNAQKTRSNTMIDKSKSLDRKLEKTSKSQEELNENQDLGGEVKKITEEIAEVMKEKLGVTDEELNEAMELLGFQMVDLLKVENITSLVLQITGVDNTMQLLTDENLYSNYKDILNTVSECLESLQSEFSITTDELKQILDDMHQPITDEPQLNEKNVEGLKDSVDESKLSEQETNTDSENDPIVIVKDERIVSLHNQSETKESEVVESQPVNELTEKNESKQDMSQSGQNLFSGSGNSGETREIFTSVESTSFSSNLPEANTEQIMKQIVDQIKITLKPEMTIMEMELNPASLGKVGVQIEARNGAVTAQFTAQNEAVKAAIESQMTLLKDSMSEQGIKVDAVEVTIASHEFERNLQQNEGGNGKEQKNDAKSTRRINLSLTEEELTEEEEIVKDMMVQNGNTIDYTA